MTLLDVTDGARRPGACPSVAAWSTDTRNDMYDERVPRRAGLLMTLRTYAVPLTLFTAAAVAALVLALR